MTVHTWFAFLLAATVLLMIPGPTVLLVIGQSLGAGRRRALPLVAGVALGDLTAMTLSLAGLGALLSASATAFTLLKWMGAIYLAYLGLKLWRAPISAEAASPLQARAAFRQAYLVTALNPKSIAFFVAFVPQFIAPEASFLRQGAILVGTFVILAATNALLYALLAGQMSSLVRRPSVRRGFNRAGGGVLMGAGVALALKR
ncbi:LysE family translocator [Acidocella aminolytica]|uniref:Lysine/threonine exporter LysE/YggA n=1 Tax=Acidocella aminolytica 101 = DSM 11237 TaxID=1120923 RepID=A0A0D6PH05_9PROT|nr:LysE family translocator [Acidocella aminolytica]GAN80104.1 lysine/threonine exporter LysE/YggA [Acidocella aminolytica 101 = DSM 11237]GBQ43521.1 putative threonine efflux protein [Acidocella aminolytica 101 = DSM 11237]SHE68799.1 Threonine/homoserine/homoserine lactone efflux protein [Acidocella aminolytica 101 = DSM 11237]